MALTGFITFGQGSANALQSQVDAVKADLKSVQDTARTSIPEAWLQVPQLGFMTDEQREEAAQQAVDDEPLAPFLPPPELDMDYRPEGNGHELVLQVSIPCQLAFNELMSGPSLCPCRVHSTYVRSRTRHLSSAPVR